MTHNDLRYEFGPYQLNPSKRILTRNGEGIPLTPKATEILLVLVKHAGQLVEKDELLKEVWPDTFVEEANLSQNIFTLRRPFGDDRTGPKFIETIARHGYRFPGSVKRIGVDEHEADDFAKSDGAAKRPLAVVLPQTTETLARLYLETKPFALAEEAIDRAVKTLELTDGEAALAESLRTAGVVAARQRRYAGDHEGAGLALLIMFEEVNRAGRGMKRIKFRQAKTPVGHNTPTCITGGLKMRRSG